MFYRAVLPVKWPCRKFYPKQSGWRTKGSSCTSVASASGEASRGASTSGVANMFLRYLRVGSISEMLICSLFTRGVNMVQSLLCRSSKQECFLCKDPFYGASQCGSSFRQGVAMRNSIMSSHIVIESEWISFVPVHTLCTSCNRMYSLPSFLEIPGDSSQTSQVPFQEWRQTKVQEYR